MGRMRCGTQNILKDADAIPEDYGRGDGIMKAGLADIVLESRKELKDIVVRLSSIILKKELLDKKDSTSDISEEQIPTSLQKTSEAI